MITSLGYGRGYLEWGFAYCFPWKHQTRLRFNLNSPSFKEERHHFRHYVGTISHEEVDYAIYLAAGRKAWRGWHDLIGVTLNRVPKRIPKPFSYTGFLTEKALSNLKPKPRKC